MKKTLLPLFFFFFGTVFVYAQSAVILPEQSDFVNSGAGVESYAIKGLISGTNPGESSAGVRGINNSISSNGFGIFGTHNGSGIGVYGSSSDGKGISGYSYNGIGILGVSINASAGVFQVSNPNSTSPAFVVTSNSKGIGIDLSLTNSQNNSRGINIVHNGNEATAIQAVANNGNAIVAQSKSITHSALYAEHTVGNAIVGVSQGIAGSAAITARNDSTGAAIRAFNTRNGYGILGQVGLSGGKGVAGRFENLSNTNASNVLEGVNYGSGATAYFSNSHPNGTSLVASKLNAYSGVYTNDPRADVEIRHTSEITVGMSGLRIMNTGPSKKAWTLYCVNYNGNLSLYANGVYKGAFNGSTGAYTNVSDARMKVGIANYQNTLNNLLKIGVKSYKLVNSDKTEIGLLAQEVAGFFPEIVYENTNDQGEQFLTMDYSRIGVLAVKAIQEQQLALNSQQQEIDTLRQQLNALQSLKAEVEELKKQIGK